MEEGKQRVDRRGHRELVLQLFLGFVANLANISPGMSLGFSAVALPQMQNIISQEEASWIASVAPISTPIGCLLSGPLLDRFGRRKALLSLNIPCFLGWLLIAFADGEWMLPMIYAGRVLTGIATGMASSPATVYSAEMCKDGLRGMIVTWTSIAISIGILLVYILGSVFQENWRLVAGLSAILPAIALVLSYFFLPESPSWLISKGKRQAAEDALKRIRGVPKHEEMPMSVETEFLRIAIRTPDKKRADGKPQSATWSKFFSTGTIKPFLIMNCFFFFQQFSGIFVVILYAVDVVKEAGITFDPYYVTILIGLTRVVITIAMSFISKRYGRRPPAIVSGAGMTLCMGTLATFLYYKSTGQLSAEEADALSWVPTTSLILYILTSTIGFLTLPWAMIGEVFPAEVRGLAAGMTTCIAYICSFVIVKIYPDMLTALTVYGVFFFYGAVSVIGTAFVVVFLPETQGKTLQEIEEYFSKRKSKKTEQMEEAGELIEERNSGVIIVPAMKT